MYNKNILANNFKKNPVPHKHGIKTT